jgi:hypothetical protein
MTKQAPPERIYLHEFEDGDKQISTLWYQSAERPIPDALPKRSYHAIPYVLESALKEAREALRLLRQQVEDTIAVAQTDECKDGFITAYHFQTGAIHRLLAMARQGDLHKVRTQAFHHYGCGYRTEAASSWECTPECVAAQDVYGTELVAEAERQLNIERAAKEDGK